MKKEIADLWIADLRSNPPQAELYLFDGKGYCCLGRLCVVLGIKPEYDDDSNHYLFDDSYDLLPNSIMNMAGMRSQSGMMTANDEDITHLTQLNDNGKSFAEIADVIEANWEQL